MNNNDMSVFDQLIDPSCVHHNFPGSPRGAEDFKKLFGMFKTAFPDIRVTLEDVFADGDKVGTRGRWVGTHKGEFMGVKPTGKSVKVEYIDLWRVKDGKFVDNWVQMDYMGLMQQLGVVPAPQTR